jgi:hypothetical protein
MQADVEIKSTKLGDTQNLRAARITLNAFFQINMIDVYQKYIYSPNSNCGVGPNAVY